MRITRTRLLRGLSVVAATAVLLATASPVLAAPPLPSLQSVLDKLDDLYKSKSAVGTMVMEVKTKHYDRALTLESWSKGDDLGLVVIRKPAREAGTATLRTVEGLWTYAPRADRLIRVPSGLLSESWAGSHFSNDDVMRDSKYADDFDSKHRWAAGQEGTVIEIEMTPKDDAAVVWTRLVFHVDATSWLPLKTDYYDGDQVVRRMTFSKVEDMGGRKIPTMMELIPLTRPGEFTRVRYKDMKFDADVDDSMFTARGVKRQAQRR